MTFGDWIENARELGADEAEIDAAIDVDQRLKVALIIARENFPDASEGAVLAVFSEICAGAALGTTVHPQQRKTLH